MFLLNLGMMHTLDLQLVHTLNTRSRPFPASSIFAFFLTASRKPLDCKAVITEVVIASPGPTFHRLLGTIIAQEIVLYSFGYRMEPTIHP